jgi:hypothetical protein
MAAVFSAAAPNKQVVFAHSAGTEAVLKSTLQAKADLYVFASPRVSRETFESLVKQAGLNPSQVLVVGVNNDFPHWPSDVIFDRELATAALVGNGSEVSAASMLDYGSNASTAYKHIFIEAGPGMIGNIPFANHSVPIEGFFETGSYTVEIDGRVVTGTFAEIYDNAIDGDN